jgi:histone acetyltransferase (RNA polymerase elongator complex component)
VKQHYNIPVFIPHLGCPFQCIFCNQNKIASTQAVPGLSDINRIIEEHLSTIKTSGENIELAFFGGSFTAIDYKLQEKYLSAVEPYLKSGRIGSIRISTRPDYIDNDILRFLARYGVKTIELGVQSFSDEVLKASGRGYSLDDVFKASHLIKSCGFKLGIQLMIGLPGDNYQWDMESTRLAITLDPDMVRIYPTLVIAETSLERLFKEKKYSPLDLPTATLICKDMFLEFQRYGIDVIRMGLQPGEELRSPGTVLAGPFHPSFGEIVEQEVFKEQALRTIERYRKETVVDRDLVLLVHKRDISKMTGLRKRNLFYLQEYFKLRTLKVRPFPSIERDAIGLGTISMPEPFFILSRQEFIEIRSHYVPAE